MGFQEWIGQSWWMLATIALLISYIVQITTGAGKLGQWAQARIFAKRDAQHEQLRSDVKAFMDEHSSCKPDTERRLKELEERVGTCEKLSSRDWESWKLQFRIDDTILEHIKHGNHLAECGEVKDELHQHLLTNR